MPMSGLIRSTGLTRQGGLRLSIIDRYVHSFWRYETGREINLEATSGALPSRMAWYRQNLPMTDRAIESGLYVRTLTRRQAIAHMAGSCALSSWIGLRHRLRSHLHSIDVTRCSRRETSAHSKRPELWDGSHPIEPNAARNLGPTPIPAGEARAFALLAPLPYRAAFPRQP
jgi:hypothetical protein